MVFNFKSPLFVYVLKCVAGICVGYWLYVTFPQHQFFWSLISVLLVLAPENTDSHKLAYYRMGANILGSVIGLLLFLLHLPELLALCIGIVIVILVGNYLKLDPAIRSALAALIIVMVHGQGHTFMLALERVGCVVVGCLIGLLITITADFIIKATGGDKAVDIHQGE